MSGIRRLLEESGYSEKAITYFEQRTNVGIMQDPDFHATYTGPCGDTMEIFLKIGSQRITEATFLAIGCAGSHTAASALTEMIKGKTIDEAKQLTEEDVLEHLGKIPKPKIHCVCLAIRTLRKAIDECKKTQLTTVKLASYVSGMTTYFGFFAESFRNSEFSDLGSEFSYATNGPNEKA